MMRTRYIALLRETADAAPAAAGAFDRLLVGRRDIVRVVETPLLSLAATPDHFVTLGAQGAVIGTVFDREHGRRQTTFDGKQRQTILESRGHDLATLFWGNYVALLVADETGTVLRSPLGTLPCLRFAMRGAVLVASDMDLLAATGLCKPEIDWEAVARGLAFRDIRPPRTCLAGIADLRGGQRLTQGRTGVAVDEVWSPWQFVSPGGTPTASEALAEGLGAVVRQCVAAQAAPFDRPLVMLSGGLDSSVVAACLAGGGHSASALNLVTIEPSGDERRYARAVAGHLGMPLAERIRDATRIDPTVSLAAGLPRPSMRMFLQESLRHAREVAMETGACAIVNGGGGDNVFCSLQSSAPVADRLRLEGPGHGALATAREVSRLAPARLGEVLADAARRAWLGKPAFRLRSDLDLFAPSRAIPMTGQDLHAWLEVPHGALPGRAMHVFLMAAAQAYGESLDPLDPLPTLAPLLSQPVVEYCLAIPSWLWVEAGRNRALARRAFSGDLPADVVNRRSKGTPDAFVAEIFETHRRPLRDMLAQGQLVRQGIADRDAVLAVIDDPRPAHGRMFRRVLEFADVEAWAACWTMSA